MSTPVAILPLYRQYLRAIRQLPLLYLRQFYRIKARDDVESLRSTSFVLIQQKKYKRISKEVRRLNKGLQGDWRSFDHILDVAYGRKGKLKHELLQPLLSDPSSQVLPPINPQVPNSRPPVYSPELRALLTSDISRTTKALKPSALINPPKLPPQADPSSEEALLFGKLSKRREKNILKRYFEEETQKVYPPWEIRVQDEGPLQDVGVRPAAGQGLHVLRDIEHIVGSLWVSPPLTRRERKVLGDSPDILSPSQRHPSRWLRRRFQSLLARFPILICRPGCNGKYSVERSSKHLGDVYSTGGRLLPVASPSQVAWHEPYLNRSRENRKRS